ncbi:hypothetical protein MKX08_007525 [Trichoderma sp. CBMAI-0020]|nr:hypothetical protein MKX08_007525 [Trichoderma sp. CBMAI-0020]
MSQTTALASEGKFAYGNGVFFAEASNRSQHRRASKEELVAHFASGSDKDHTAHWFEAQLIHHGLQPSKVKSVARMRLFDAVRQGTLSVPLPITDLEKKLKKEWTKREREDKKKATKGLDAVAASQAGPSRKTTTGKRKADVIVNVTINTHSPGSIAPTTAKRAKTSASSEKGPAPARQYATKQTARRGSSSRASSRQEPASRTAPAPAPAPVPRVRQTARRSRPFAPRGRIQSSYQGDGYSDYADPFDEPPPPYEDSYDEDSQEDSRRPVQRASLATLGLLNGRYDISSRSVDEEWPRYASGLSLVLTLAGSSLWGRFDLGIIEGVLYFEERPRKSSLDAVQFSWRGREAEGPISYDDRRNKGWIKFLGGGRIEGWIDHLDIYFEGDRMPGQGTRSEVEARSMQNEWDGYTEDEYERENRGRWG